MLKAEETETATAKSSFNNPRLWTIIQNSKTDTPSDDVEDRVEVVYIIILIDIRIVRTISTEPFYFKDDEQLIVASDEYIRNILDDEIERTLIFARVSDFECEILFKKQRNICKLEETTLLICHTNSEVLLRTVKDGKYMRDKWCI